MKPKTKGEGQNETVFSLPGTDDPEEKAFEEAYSLGYKKGFDDGYNLGELEREKDLIPVENFTDNLITVLISKGVIDNTNSDKLRIGMEVIERYTKGLIESVRVDQREEDKQAIENLEKYFIQNFPGNSETAVLKGEAIEAINNTKSSPEILNTNQC